MSAGRDASLIAYGKLLSAASPIPTTVPCTQCHTDRRITSVMGGNYYTLSTCGHVVGIDHNPEVAR